MRKLNTRRSLERRRLSALLATLSEEQLGQVWRTMEEWIAQHRPEEVDHPDQERIDAAARRLLDDIDL